MDSWYEETKWEVKWYQQSSAPEDNRKIWWSRQQSKPLVYNEQQVEEQMAITRLLMQKGGKEKIMKW